MKRLILCIIFTTSLMLCANSYAMAQQEEKQPVQ